MSYAANSESPTDPAPREEDDNDDLVLEEDGSSRQNGREETQIAVPEKFVIVAVSESEMMRRLSHECWSKNGVVAPVGLRPPSNPQLQSRQSRVAGSDNRPASAKRHQPFDEIKGVESTLFAHVIFATRFLQETVAVDPHSNDAAEMSPALDALRSMVSIQKQHNEAVEDLPPFSKPIPPGLDLRDLPIPSMDRILACLRAAQERLSTQFYWPFEFGSLGDFTQYVVKACSPGPVTDMELIIVHYGLNCLFTECATVAVDDIAKQDHETQALICRDSLEIILSNLSFHITTNKDSVCAMYMATLYCLYQGKPFAAWAFISKASLMSQALGLHSNYAILYESAEETARKTRLFWALYTIEKEMALRLGRSSTIRDHDITVPRLILDRKMTSLIYHRLPDWIDVASLYGRVGVPSGQSSRLALCPECISSAILAIKEVELCIAMLGDMELQSPSLDRWISEIIFLAPFMPFMILFCNVIETSDLSHLDHLQRLVDNLQSMARSQRYSTCSKQLQILNALCDVARKFVETKATRKPEGLMGGHVTDLDINNYLDGNELWFDNESPPSPIFPTPEHFPTSDAQRARAAFPTEGTDNQGYQVVNAPFEFQPRANTLGVQYQLPGYSMELDATSSQLESWLH
ncbi:Transcription factor [Penicillium griseofulvum]|uniref:Transcription factor n=1 Tax=Penicillium patulum TaxID=5078 RepID=A0A135LRF3_PENPA|nr:Transcription factor [Penicillium griseofulvum]KXG51557.1 Transcription factor [Penicillium griseofulvum]